MIARQNIQRLKIPGYDASVLASRLTLLPLQVKELSSQKVNFMAFTPGTSFEQTAGGGVMWERPHDLLASRPELGALPAKLLHYMSFAIMSVPTGSDTRLIDSTELRSTDCDYRQKP